jgi:mannose-6-phosphate isomerase-like protein (cupin superfamily)
MCILREVMPAGTDTGETMLRHDGEEGGVIIAGQVEVTVGDQVRVLGPGEAYYFESRVPHRFRNVGEGDAVIVSANTPATF